MKSVAILVGGLAASATLIAGATFALFAAQPDVQGDTFQAAQLCVTAQRDNGDTASGPMFYIASPDPNSGTTGLYPTGPWVPGDVVTRELNVTNTCPDGPSTNAWLASVSATPNAGFAPSHLSDQLVVQVLAPEQGSPANYVLVAQAPLDAFLSGPVPLAYSQTWTTADGRVVNAVPLAATSTEDLQFRVAFNRDAGNAYQDLQDVIDFHVTAVQQVNNTPYYYLGTLASTLPADTTGTPGADGSFGYNAGQSVALVLTNAGLPPSGSPVDTLTLSTDDPAYTTCFPAGTTLDVYQPSPSEYEAYGISSVPGCSGKTIALTFGA